MSIATENIQRTSREHTENLPRMASKDHQGIRTLLSMGHLTHRTPNPPPYKGDIGKQTIPSRRSKE